MLVLRMAHRKWKEFKQQPSMLPGSAVPGCCLASFHFLWAILSTGTVYYNYFFRIKCAFIGYLSQFRAKLRGWAVRPTRAGRYSWAAMLLIDSKTLYSKDPHPVRAMQEMCFVVELICESTLCI